MSDTSHIDAMLFEAACHKSNAAGIEHQAAQEALRNEHERSRPFFLLTPRIYPNGNQWCCLYGDNLQEGVAGFGDTPHKASLDFDRNWLNQALAIIAAPPQPSDVTDRNAWKARAEIAERALKGLVDLSYDAKGLIHQQSFEGAWHASRNMLDGLGYYKPQEVTDGN